MTRIVFLRGFHIAPEPRLEKSAKWIKDTFDDTEIIALGWDREGKAARKEKNDYFAVERMCGYGRYGGGFRENILGLILFNLWLFYKLILIRPQIIHACDLDVSLPGLIVSKMFSKRFVYDIYDFYSDNRDLGILDKPIRKLERIVSENSDITIICDERRMSQLGDNVKDNVIVVYNTPDDLYRERKTKCDFLVSYVGVLIPGRKIIESIDYIVNTLGEHCACAGFGALEHDIKDIASANGFLTFYGKVDYDKALAIENNSYAILAFYDPHLPNNRYAAPNKLCEAMMLGKPIITSKGTMCGELVERERIGIAVEYNNDDELHKAINYLRSNKSEMLAMGKRARELYVTKYSAHIAKRILCDAYCKLMDS